MTSSLIDIVASFPRVPVARERHVWTDRDLLLYALALGFGEDPLDKSHLPFVDESALKPVPSFATVHAWVAAPTFTSLGVDPVMALHAEQQIEIHALPEPGMDIDIEGTVLGICDKGEARGALVTTRHRISRAASGRPVATLTTTCFARGQGGCGSAGVMPATPHALPGRPPDKAVEFDTRADLALLYRLTGDRNPVHAAPEVARAAGFERPLLHGLCTFGLACRAILESYADLDPARMTSQQGRFSAPVYPGDRLRVELWRDGAQVSFQVLVPARGSVVLSNGLGRLSA